MSSTWQSPHQSPPKSRMMRLCVRLASARPALMSAGAAVMSGERCFLIAGGAVTGTRAGFAVGWGVGVSDGAACFLQPVASISAARRTPLVAAAIVVSFVELAIE